MTKKTSARRPTSSKGKAKPVPKAASSFDVSAAVPVTEETLQRFAVRDRWTIHETACLSNDTTPNNISPEACEAQVLGRSADTRTGEAYRLLKDALKAQRVGEPIPKAPQFNYDGGWYGFARVVPSSALRWLKTKGFVIPAAVMDIAKSSGATESPDQRR